ncbi:hypothetical protein [Streptomyces sp. NPDC007117]|uniref:hypothetical protein n=1 Tax=unclassified Streptomyces TaxID=2593676 RepID=UPI0033C6F774
MNVIATPARRAAIAGLSVLLAGFGALFVFHLVMDRDSRLPGMFVDLCETWGDALALPVMTGALVFTISALPKAAPEGGHAAASATAGGTAGALTQLVRWKDEAHQLTWAHPEPHHFNAAGIYHAAFLTAMCAVTAVLWTLALKRAARAGAGHRGRPGGVRALLVAMVAGLAFVVLLMIDDWEFLSTRSGAAVLATTAAAAVLAVGLFTTVMVRMHRVSLAPADRTPLSPAGISSTGGSRGGSEHCAS